MKKQGKQECMIRIRIQADDSFQIKRVIKAFEREKGFVLTSRSGIKRNRGEGPKLREFITFRDLKAETKHPGKQKTNDGSCSGQNRQ